MPTATFFLVSDEWKTRSPIVLIVHSQFHSKAVWTLPLNLAEYVLFQQKSVSFNEESTSQLVWMVLHVDMCLKCTMDTSKSQILAQLVGRNLKTQSYSDFILPSRCQWTCKSTRLYDTCGMVRGSKVQLHCGQQVPWETV